MTLFKSQVISKDFCQMIIFKIYWHFFQNST